MNVTSLELSKELYAVSGWKDTAFWHNEASAVTEPTMRVWVVSDHEGGYDRAPAYDLGYLLRKLPLGLHLAEKAPVYGECYLELTHYGTGEGWWHARYHQNDQRVEPNQHRYYFKNDADTPEDAAAKLAIELFKQGVLARDAA